MNIQHFPISVTEKQCGHVCEHPQADLTAYLLDPMEETKDRLRPAVVICPGGGYNHVSQREDQPVAMEYLAMGCQVFVLHYSVAPDRFPRALMELAPSVDLIRKNSRSWQIDPNRILVSGFSAGGHLACSLGVFWDKDFLFGPIEKGPENIRPNGLILCYPVITSGEYAHRGSVETLLGPQQLDNEEMVRLFSLENQVGPQVPPVFLWHTWTDQTVPVENSLLLASALRKHGISLEMHIYPRGIHGLSTASHEVEGRDGRYYEPSCQSWLPLVKTWLESF